MPTYGIFWTSEVKDSSGTWIVGFHDGFISWIDKSRTTHALCVR